MAKQKTYNSELLKHIGLAIKKRRSGQSISQEMLAELSDLHTTTISDIERGKSNMTIISLELIAKALKCSPVDLFPLKDGSIDRELSDLTKHLIEIQNGLNAVDRKRVINLLKGLVKAFS